MAGGVGLAGGPPVVPQGVQRIPRHLLPAADDGRSASATSPARCSGSCPHPSRSRSCSRWPVVVTSGEYHYSRDTEDDTAADPSGPRSRRVFDVLPPDATIVSIEAPQPLVLTWRTNPLPAPDVRPRASTATSTTTWPGGLSGLGRDIDELAPTVIARGTTRPPWLDGGPGQGLLVGRHHPRLHLVRPPLRRPRHPGAPARSSLPEARWSSYLRRRVTGGRAVKYSQAEPVETPRPGWGLDRLDRRVVQVEGALPVGCSTGSRPTCASIAAPLERRLARHRGGSESDVHVRRG